jgi:hypothetical protein
MLNKAEAAADLIYGASETVRIPLNAFVGFANIPSNYPVPRLRRGKREANSSKWAIGDHGSLTQLPTL